MEQKKTPLFDAITDYIDTNPAYFRIPGHRLEKGISSRWTEKVGSDFFKYDVTETPMTDDLHNPEGPILEAQELLANLYGAEKSYFLVNGTTCGNEAMIMSTALEGEEILVARNAHKSAMMGLIISGARPVYIMPEICEDWGIQGGITPEDVEKMFQDHPKAKALFMVSPSYYGICSDLEKIAKVCHQHDAYLLVDEAHGGHLYFGKEDNRPRGALQQGADVCVQSMHKITGAMTQSSVLHINRGCKDYEELKNNISKNLHIVQSTSPSYILMTSLDTARYELAINGEKMYEKALQLAKDTREKINQIKGISCMGKEVIGKNGITTIDETRLVISAKEIGLSGFELDEILFGQYHVDMELSDAENVLAIVTYANEKEDLERLIFALKEIARNQMKLASRIQDEKEKNNRPLPEIPKQFFTPRKAYFSKMHPIAWKDAVGKVSGEMLAPYPPGIPVIYPGEIVTKEVWEYMENCRKENRHMHGPADEKLDTLQIIDE